MLPAWKAILNELGMAIMFLPRDVRTHWNSMFNMLEYALNHRKAIDEAMQCHDLGLRKLEISDYEWELMAQLYDVLKVRTYLINLEAHCSGVHSRWMGRSMHD